MGLLDDAIREHLELKRKHGASDDDVRRQETEALGPARRDFAAAEPPLEEAPAPPVPSDDAAGDYAAPAPEPAGWLDEDEGVAPFDAEAPAEPTVVQEPAPPPPPDPAPAPRRTSDTPTQGFDALSLEDDDDAEAPAGDEEDVLEETPDFLQDTPEHDRLWFEQKPPRDFDFDD